MKRRAPAALVVILAALAVFVPAAPAAADGGAFVVRDFSVEYHLGRDADGHSTLRTVETITIGFLDGDSHGPLRYLVEDYDAHPTDLVVESVTDASGAAVPYEEDWEDDYRELRIGDEDEYVEGDQTYVITYTQKHVTHVPDDAAIDEFYWEANGTEWDAPFERVESRVFVDAALVDALTGAVACYRGDRESSAPCDEIMETTGETYEVVASAEDLGANEGLTVAIGFEQGTFTPRDDSPFTTPFFSLQAAAAVLAVILALWALVLLRTTFRSAPGRPTIVAEYLPPKGVSLLDASFVVGHRSKAVAASLVDFAVRGVLRIIEEPGAKGKPAYGLTLVDPSRLSPRESALAAAFLGSRLSTGAHVSLATKDSALSTAIYTVVHDAHTASAKGPFHKSVPAGHRVVPLVLGLLAAVLSFVMFAIQMDDGRQFVLPLLLLFGSLGGLAVVCSVVFRSPLTAAGAELRDHLAGLRLYIQVAEKDRLRVLQSPEGAERTPVDTADRGQMLHLYERVLPYAVLFGEEKRWATELGRYYDDVPPEWYSGNGAFSAAAFATGIHSMASTTSAGFAGTTSSSGSGSGGGGSVGGGGGGGGGGSW